MTLNYELDPANAAVIMAIFNGCGDAAGFINSAVMTALMKDLDKTSLSYVLELKKRWRYFFYINALAAFTGIVVFGGTYLIRPYEWVKHPQLTKEEEEIKKITKIKE